MKSKRLLFIILLLLTVFITGCYKKQVVDNTTINNQREPSQNGQSQQNQEQEEGPLKLEDVKVWKIYRNDELGFEFNYPDQIGELSYNKYNNQFIILPSNLVPNKNEYYFAIGGVTKNYSANKEGGSGTFSGFKKDGDKYFFEVIGDISFEIVPKKVVSENVLLVDCMSYEEKCNIKGPSRSLLVNEQAGLINLNHEKFNGLMFRSLKDRISEELFTKMLESFKIF
ncbi:MAG: hypothetical protein ABIE43_02040 [Patescibacteria group bacterium]